MTDVQMGNIIFAIVVVHTLSIFISAVSLVFAVEALVRLGRIEKQLSEKDEQNGK